MTAIPLAGFKLFSSPPSICTAFAARQLPTSVVRSVNAIEARRKIATADSNAFMTVLESRPISGGTAEAFANFDPQYCGFDGNINDFPSSNAMPQDYVVLIRDGRRTEADPNGVCISNTVPTAKMVKGVIVMMFRCDRLYPNNTWTQANPKLRTTSG